MSSAFCPQCGRQLPTADSLTAASQTCPGCGYVVRLTGHAPGAQGDDESATRPVPREVLGALSPGVAPVNTTSGLATTDDNALDGATRPAPARSRDANGALTMQTADYPAQRAPARAETPATPAGRVARADAPASPDGAGAPRRRPWVALSIVALIVVLLASALTAVFLTSPQSSAPPTGAQATATSAPTATATPVTALPTLTFTKAGLYRMNYPAGWLVNQQNTGGGSVVLFSGQQSVGVNPGINLQVIPANESAPDMATRDSDILNASASSGSIHNQTTPISVTVGGQSWTQIAADATLNGSTQTAHLVVLSVAHGANVYSLTYYAAVASFANENSAVFQPAITSFAFLA